MGFFDSFRVDAKVHLSTPVVYPGGEVRGVVVVTVSSDASIVGVRIRLTGAERTLATKTTRHTHGTGKRRRSTTTTHRYRSEAFVLHQVITLCGQMEFTKSRESITLPKGTYHYPFAHRVPARLPPSYDVRWGSDAVSVTYAVEAIVDIPSGLDATHAVSFGVVQVMPMGQLSDSQPQQKEELRSLTFCCCCDRGTLRLGAWVDRSIVVMEVGALRGHVRVDNSLGRSDVSAIVVSLVNVIDYTAQSLHRVHSTVVATVTVAGCAPGAGQSGEGVFELPLPRAAAPTYAGINARSRYEVCVGAEMSWASDVAVSLLVVLAQAYDPTNGLPRYDFGAPPVTVQPGQFMELYYQPPPGAANYSPAPVPPPPQATLQSYNYEPLGLTPSADWAALYGKPVAPEKDDE